MRRRFMNSQSYDFNSYLTIEALEDEFSVSFTNDLQYSINGGRWNRLQGGKSTPCINVGDRISFKGKLIPKADGGGVGTFHIDKSCNLLGNCMSILYDEYLTFGAFSFLFHYCTGIKGVSKDFLPATTLAKSCYNSMFYGCTSLVNAPALPATTLAARCYYHMFRNCTNLSYIKMLATDISATYCLWDWVRGVSSTGTFVKSKDATWNTTPGALGTDGVPAGWTVVNDGEEGNVGSGGEITFYVNEVEFKALDGMTWQAYVDSDYNYTVKDGNNSDNWKFIISVNNGIEEPKFYDEDYEAHWPIYTGNYQVQISSDKIIANKQYYSD